MGEQDEIVRETQQFADAIWNEAIEAAAEVGDIYMPIIGDRIRALAKPGNTDD